VDNLLTLLQIPSQLLNITLHRVEGRFEPGKKAPFLSSGQLGLLRLGDNLPEGGLNLLNLGIEIDGVQITGNYCRKGQKEPNQ
jgi:hypothetical protein